MMEDDGVCSTVLVIGLKRGPFRVQPGKEMDDVELEGGGASILRLKRNPAALPYPI